MNAFVSRHQEKITGVLHCFDRVVFHGHLPINYPQALRRFLATRNVPIQEFGRFVEQQSNRLRLAAEELAARVGRPCVYSNKPGRKEEWAHRLAEKDGIREGLVGILRTTEGCQSFKVRQMPDGPKIISAPRRGLHLYFYFIDPQLGWMHVRLQTWFPFLIQIAVNGHDILARQMDHAGIAYQRYENGFTWIGDMPRAQRFAERHPGWAWTTHLDRIAERVNPLLGELLRPLRYRWVTDQCEMATDLLFEDAPSLGKLYKKLVTHATACFTAEDVLGFLGRRLHGLFSGEVLTETRERHWGVSIKHRIRKNWIKMYNKGGSILRVETVINHAADFRIRRMLYPRRGEPHMGIGPMAKSVHYLGRYWEIQMRANRHYLNALACVEDPTEAYADIGQIASPQRHQQQRVRALNPLAEADRKLLTAVMRGEHHLQGFRNEFILRQLHGELPDDPRVRKRLGARVRRQLLMLRAHRLVRRIPGSRRYRVTQRGFRLISAALFYATEDLPQHIMAIPA
jgi:hypothetical protein